MSRWILILAALTPGLADAQALYPMESGNFERQNRALNPSSVTTDLETAWVTQPCVLQVPVGGPLVLSDRVVQAYRNGIRCVDRETGAPLWLCHVPGYELFNTPTYDADRDLLYVGLVNGATVCLSPSTGEVRWYHFEGLSGYPWQFSAPLYAEGRLFVGTGGTGFACLDPDTREVVWRLDFSTYFDEEYLMGTCTPAYRDGRIYLSTVYGDLFCLRAADGTVL